MGLSLTLDRGTVMSLFKKKQEVLQRAQAKAAQGPAFTEETVEKDTQVMVGDPVQVPDGLLEAVCQLAAQREDIRTLWRADGPAGRGAEPHHRGGPHRRPGPGVPGHSPGPPAPTAGSCLWT